MSIQLFSALTVMLLVFTLFIKRREIKEFTAGNLYYACLILMIAAILHYPTAIQYALRAVALIISWLIILLKTRFKISFEKNNLSSKLILLFMIAAFLSVVFSTNLIESFIKLVEIMTDFMLLWQIYKFEGHNEFVYKTYKLLHYVCFVLLVITAFGFILVPSVFANTGYSASNSLLGIRIGNGLIGANTASAFAIICLTWVIFVKKKLDLNTFIVVGICAYVMLFSQSRASLVMIPLMIFLRLFKPNSKYYIFYILIVIVAAIAVLYNKDLLLQYLLRGQSTSQIQSMSGRIDVWKIALDYFYKRPILGYGYGVGGSYVSQFLTGGFKGIQHMHNGFVETLVDTGVIGLVLLLFQVVYCVGMTIYNTLKMGVKNNMIDLLLVAYFIIRSYTSLGFGNWHSMELILWYYMLLSIRQGKSIQILLNRQ